ncbi:MAG: O-antigen ligase family protein [Rhizobiaceae bacterium]|nr:O-antigen ligase family protein [Rhizobiaceae bacterium]
MSSIAAPNRTDRSAERRTVDAVRTALAATILTALLVSFTPFVAVSEASGASGNIVNQLGYSALGIAALASHFLFTDRRVALALLRPTWLVMLGFLILSVAQSNWPDLALRAVLFSLFAMIAATGVVSLPPDARTFRKVLAVAALAVLGLSYFGIVAMPAAAIHDASGAESQHSGLWRGIYSHKNVAAPVMAALFFAGLYLVRSGERGIGWLITVLAGLFVYMTGSKTTAGLVPFVAFLIIAARVFGGRVLPVLILGVALVAMALLTVGAALSPTLDGVLQQVLPGTTFTGRMDLWRFALDTMAPRQWSGFGFESFWLTDNVFRAEMPFELSWDPRGIVNAHSGYLDIAISMGWPALFVASLVLVVLPFKDYVACRPSQENERLADFFLMVLAFALMSSFLESYFFKRADPVWMLTWIAVVGLRLVSKFRMTA